jgi:uroporphyrinogen III methyltransferase/synthase
MTQRSVRGTLEDIAKKVKREKLLPPAIVIIGEVVKVGEKFDWLKKGKKVLFTGLSKERFFLKGNYFHLPLIRIEPMKDYSEFDGYLRDIKRFEWVVFSSRYGVKYFFERLMAIGKDVRSLGGIKIAAIGTSTKNALFALGITTDLVPREESSRGLLKEFGRLGVNGKRIFLPRSDISDKNLSSGLGDLGAIVTTTYAYRNVPAQTLPDLDLGWFDEVAFTSPSGVRNFVKKYKGLPKGVKADYIGDVTSKEAKRWHLAD